MRTSPPSRSVSMRIQTVFSAVLAAPMVMIGRQVSRNSRFRIIRSLSRFRVCINLESRENMESLLVGDIGIVYRNRQAISMAFPKKTRGIL